MHRTARTALVVFLSARATAEALRQLRPSTTSLKRGVNGNASLRRYGFFLCLLLGWYRPFCGSSLRCFFALQISSASLALNLYPKLLSHGISMD